jgi:hypothetical protein
VLLKRLLFRSTTLCCFPAGRFGVAPVRSATGRPLVVAESFRVSTHNFSRGIAEGLDVPAWFDDDSADLLGMEFSGKGKCEDDEHRGESRLSRGHGRAPKKADDCR